MTARPPEPDRSRWPASAAVVLVLLLALAMAAGCLEGTPAVNRTGNLPGVFSNITDLPVTVTPPIPQDKYIFIKHWIHTNGEMISGDCCGGPVFGDPPGFRFDKKNGILKVRDYYSDKLNESFFMFYADGGNLSGCAGMGEDSWGLPVYSLPFTPKFPDREKK